MISASFIARASGALSVVILLNALQMGKSTPEPGARFLGASSMQKENVFAELKRELSTSVHVERIEELEALLRPMYVALPKLPDGTLGHTVMRYALHRLLAKAHGWFVIGLEPERDGMNMSVSSIKAQMEWAPSYLQEVLESSHRGRGVSLHEVAVLATTLEDLARKEAVGRLEAVYDIYGIDKTEQYLAEENYSLILESSALVYFKGGNWTAQTGKEARQRISNFKRNHKQTPRLQQWLGNLSAESFEVVGARNFTFTARVVEQMGKKYGAYNQPDCTGLKQTLVSIEDRMPGRVLLSDFYAKGLHGQWKFTEKVEYLRDVGALDEADPEKPRVIVPNYVGSRPQCLAASGLYAICCPNECESLMDRIESAIEEPEAPPKQVREIVQTLASPTVAAPRVLSSSLISRLDSVASANGGRIPLHGRLFAQWMHNAFPRECPFPHTAGAISPQTPDEWMRNTGHTSTQASEEEMVCHVSGPCAGGASMQSTTAQELQGDDLAVEIPWSDAEELLDSHSRPSLQNAFKHVSHVPQASAQDDYHLNKVMRIFAMAGAAVGLAFSFKVPLNQACGGSMKSNKATRLLFGAPLLILTLDMIFGFPFYELFFVCALCWGFAAFAYITQPALAQKSDTEYWKEKCAV